MTRVQSYFIALTASLIAGHAMAGAADTHITRKEVKAELIEANRTGNITSGEGGLKLNEEFPSNYPTQRHVASKSREQVKAELAEAIQNGHVISGENGLELYEEFPQNYAAHQKIIGKSREQVKAELSEAIRSGQANAYIEP